jgi:hypothetical protein
MKKGIGPRALGSPAKMYGAKSPAKQTKKQDYYNLQPKDAKTYADSVAVETAHLSRGGRAMGEAAGKIASGGDLDGRGGFTQGNTPNSERAKTMLKDTRALARKYGKDPMSAYKK